MIAMYDLSALDTGSQDSFYDIPYPNDVRTDADGTVSLTGHPSTGSIVSDYLAVIDQRQVGFGANSAIFQRFDGLLTEASLPQTPEESLQENASVYLVNIDTQSSRFGERAPLQMQFKSGQVDMIPSNHLAVLPYPGYPLAEDSTYAFVVTDRVLSASGEPISVSEDFSSVLSGASGNTKIDQVYAPFLEWLDASSIDSRDSVVSAAVFTTQDITGVLRKARQVVHTLPDPVWQNITVASSSGPYTLFDGEVEIANFQQGVVPYELMENGGNIALDTSGIPVISRMETIRFSMTVPDGDTPANGWPVVIYSHGTGGNYHSFEENSIAQWLSEQGIAAISTDQVLHSPRVPDGSDPSLLFFNIFNPLSARNNPLQGAVDNFELVRLAKVLSFSDPDPTSRNIYFDPQNIMFLGHSQGGLVGVPFAAFEPDIKAMVFSGTGGFLTSSLLEKTSPIDIPTLVATVLNIRQIDEYHPFIALAQAWFDRADAINYAQYFLRGDNSPKNVFLLAGLVDTFTPASTTYALTRALGVDQVEPVFDRVPYLELQGAKRLQAPVLANYQGATAVMRQFPASNGDDGHFVLFNDYKAGVEAIWFLGSQVRDGIPTILDL